MGDNSVAVQGDNVRLKKIFNYLNTFIVNMYKITGLPNIGNTCYINSVTQCLLHQLNFNPQI